MNNDNDNDNNNRKDLGVKSGSTIKIDGTDFELFMVYKNMSADVISYMFVVHHQDVFRIIIDVPASNDPFKLHFPNMM